MKISQLNFKNNNLSFKGRKKKSASFDGPNNRCKRTDSQLKIELPLSRSDYLITSNGDLRCNHYREGKQIGNSDFFEPISVTPIDSNEDIHYNPSCDYSFYDNLDLTDECLKLEKDEIQNYAITLSKKILNYACENNELFSNIEDQNYFYSILNADFNVLNKESKNIISQYMSLDKDIKEKTYDIYCEQLSKTIVDRNNKVFYRYCKQQKKLSLAKANGQVYDNEEIILQKLSEHSEEINYLWTNIFTMTSMFKGIFTNFFDLSDLPCSCCGIPLKKDNISVEHIRPHCVGRKLMKNIQEDDKFNIVNKKFNSPRNFIFEHQICNNKRGNTDFIDFLNNTENNFGQNVINNINGIIALIKNDVNLAKSLKSYNKFVEYCLRDILFYYKNKIHLMTILMNNLNKYNPNEQINKDTILNEFNVIIKKTHFSNYRVINSIKKYIETFSNPPNVNFANFKEILKNQINIEKEEVKKSPVKKIHKLLRSKQLYKVMTKNETDNLLDSQLNLSDIDNPPIIKEIKYLYNHYCVLKYYPPVISKTIYRETGGKVNIGLSSWAGLMYDIENKDKPKEKMTFFAKYIKPIGTYAKSLFYFRSSRISTLPRM